MSDVELLRELAMSEVEATPVGAGDHTAGTVPPWAEIRLKVSRENGTSVAMDFTRHDCELVIEVLHGVLHPATNRQHPAQRLWAELDETMDYLMDSEDPEPEDRATARALALAIAMVTQPHSEVPDIDTVRAEAVARWEERGTG